MLCRQTAAADLLELSDNIECLLSKCWELRGSIDFAAETDHNEWDLGKDLKKEDNISLSKKQFTKLEPSIQV